MPETSPASAGRERPPSPVTPSQRERIAALVHERWWVVEEPDGIGLIDAGRLARRVAVLADREAPRRLLVPVRIAVPSGVVRQVETEGETLAAAGLVVARFSATEVAVRAMPAAVADVEPAEVLRVALSAGGDVREAWAERLPPAPVPDDLPARANALGLPLGPRVGGVVLT